MGFSNDIRKWLEGYLSMRMFSVNRKQLGSLLFLLYANDMVHAVNCELPLYADDSGITF